MIPHCCAIYSRSLTREGCSQIRNRVYSGLISMHLQLDTFKLKVHNYCSICFNKYYI